MICPACGALDLVPVLHRARVPTILNRVWADAEGAKAVARGTLELVGCRHCDHIWNAAFDNEKLRYDQEYENSQAHSPRFATYLDERQSALGQWAEPGSVVVEIGCGQGALLTELCTRFGWKGIGFDPAYRGPQGRGSPKFFSTTFGPHCPATSADLVLCRHVIEHLDDPVSTLRQIRRALPPDRDTTVIFECPDLGWIVDNQVHWDFFYEHVQYFSRTSLRAAFARAGFEVQGHERVFSGQYQWCRASPSKPSNTATTPSGLVDRARDLANRHRAFVDRLATECDRLSHHGGVALWGAGAKGVTLADQLVGERVELSGIIDINPAKQGGYAAGSGRAIFAPAQIATEGIHHVIVLNPNYLPEIIAQVETVGHDVQVYLAASDGSLRCRHSSPSASRPSSAQPSSSAA